MWRASFERAVGVVDPHPIEEQVRYLQEQVVPANEVLVVIEESSSAVVGFIAFSAQSIVQLYVHVLHQGRGIGSALLDIAKERSGGALRLFTFDANAGAQRFYEHHGFVVVARGFEPMWGLKDIEYEWVRR